MPQLKRNQPLHSSCIRMTPELLSLSLIAHSMKPISNTRFIKNPKVSSLYYLLSLLVYGFKMPCIWRVMPGGAPWALAAWAPPWTTHKEEGRLAGLGGVHLDSNSPLGRFGGSPSRPQLSCKVVSHFGGGERGVSQPHRRGGQPHLIRYAPSPKP
jgi:hypothetical protein